MARTMRMPSEADLPPGTTRDFVELLFHIYRQAHRPTLRAISDQIRTSDLRGTASTETIRRMLRGTTVPANWETVDAVLQTLADMAGKNPDLPLNWDGEDGTARKHVERLWHRALDEPGFYSHRPEPSMWAGGSITSSYPDEPPF